ncbi:MAG: DEAD/DEAH box helicase family protein [Gammaproteobacteria bacterium]|nr:DEAD/DEAH box helicase family protein [Gammaproteobacteria bacterium]
METPNPEEQPILHTPWEEPTSHYKVDQHSPLELPVYTKGRRPSQPSIADIGRKNTEKIVSQHDEPYATVNEIRDYVSEWREDGFKGTRAQKLLARWVDEANDPYSDTPTYFCQREAVETIMWLLRDYQDDQLRRIRGRLREVNATWNEGINRLAVKMATGAGKTRVMTMLIGCLEKIHPEGCHVVIINPNLTVQDRLQTIKRDVRRSDIVPHRDNSLTQATIHILNFHKFRQNEETFSGLGSPPSGVERRVLGTVVKIETRKSMLDRLLDEDSDRLPLYVFQDEGHHCRRRGEQATSGDMKGDELDQEGQWFSALVMLRAERDLRAVIDFSATPAYLKKPRGLNTAVFPWVVSDFGIEDAIEAGICKIPRLPISEELDDVESGISNLYRHCIDDQKQKPKWGEEPPQEVKALMRALAGDWRKNRLSAYQSAGRVPAVIVVVNSVHNAIVLYNWVSGSPGDDGLWQPGSVEEFSNIDESTGFPLPIEDLPTIMAHSRIADGGEDLNAQAKKIIEGQKELRAPETSEKEASEVIRNIINTVGVPSKPGGRIRCVISVAMLSEGWDARTVTHVFGFRRFNSVLLIEQVVGRALRRISLDTPGVAEYAEVFGVPYPGLRKRRGEERNIDEIPTPKVVESRDEKADYQITWPNIKNLEITIPEGNRFRLIPEQVSDFKPDLPNWELQKLRNPAGIGEETTIESTNERVGKITFQLAKELVDLWLGSLKSSSDESSSPILNRRGLLFVDAKRAIDAWLKHERVKINRIDLLSDPSLLQVVIEEVAKCCVNETGADSGLRVVFDDGPKTTTTRNVRFETTLKEYVYPLRKSHLNAAACHSGWESRVARSLDTHDSIKSWVRNFRLDWRIPWWDTRMGSWREYEPDFVALMNGAETHNLVIEVKGHEDPASELKKQAAERWCEVLTSSKDLALKGRWTYVYVTDPNQFETQLNEILGE